MSQDKPTRTAEPVVVTSAWPWRGSEQRMIVATAVMGLGLAVWLQGWWWIAAAIGLGCAFWLYRIGDYRKQRSLVTVTISSDRVTVRARNTMGDSAVAIGDVEQVGYRDFQSDRVLLLVGGGTAARIPERMLDQEPVREVLRRVLARDPRVSSQSRDVLAAAGLV